MRVILDANVLIAAVAARGLCEAVVETCLEQHQIVLCEAILEEVDRKLRGKLKVPAEVVDDFVTLLRANAELFEPEAVALNACRDPKDLMLLGLVTPGTANAIVSGDKGLLMLGRFKAAMNMNPRSFWDSARRG